MHTFTLCYDKEDIKKLWPYTKSDIPDDLNTKIKQIKKYPILARFKAYDGGLMGDGYNLHILEIPEGIHAKSFLAGANATHVSLGSY